MAVVPCSPSLPLPDENRSATAPWSRAERTAWATGGLVLLAGCFAFVLYENPRFFYFDDVEHELMPMIRAIGGTLGLFDWPSITLRSWSVSYLDSEQVLGHFNPLNRLLYRWMATESDFRLATAVYALTQIGLLYVGTYLAARSFGASPAASMVAGFVMATNNLIVFWFAISWWNILASLPYFAFAIFFRQAQAPHPVRLIGTAVATYLTITCAAIHTSVALATFLLLLDFAAYRRGKPLRSTCIGTAGLVSGVALAAHAWLPLMLYLPVSGRSAIGEMPDAWSAAFGDLLQFAYPMFRPNIVRFIRYDRVAVPMYFVGWFTLVLLVTAPRQRWRDHWPRLWPLVIAGLIFFVAAQGPEMLGPTRFAFRFMPFLTFALLMVTAVIGARDRTFACDKSRRAIAVGLSAYSLLYAAQRGSSGFDWLSYLLWGASVAALLFRTVLSEARTWAFCLLVSVCFFVQTHAMWWGNSNLTDWHSPDNTAQYERPRLPDPGRYTAYLLSSAWSTTEEFHAELSTGNLGLNTGRNLVFGYTPTGNAAFNRSFCMFFFGWVCDRAVSKLLEPDPATNKSLADLMRIDEVIAAPELGKRFAVSADAAAWNEVTEAGRTRSRHWLRSANFRELPGTVSSASDDVRWLSTSAAEGDVERHFLENTGGDTTVVFARLYLDGYRITLNGRPLPAAAHHGFLLATKLPAHASGTLELRFVSPARTGAVAVTGLGCLLLALHLAWLRRSGAASCVRPTRRAVTTR